MTYKEESYILDSITQIKAEVHQNSLMTGTDGAAVSSYAFDDFGRNILANLISGLADLKGFRRS